MKKILVFILACFVLSACSDRVKKGDGSNWFIEPITIGRGYHGIIHSTFDCPTVKNGVAPNGRMVGKKSRHSFCTKCMNEELIGKWCEWFEKKEKEEKNK